MKKPVVIWTLVAATALIGVLVVVFVPGRERVSLTLSHYHRWPHGATLKLRNDTKRTITYLTDKGGFVFLSWQKTPNGWTNTSLPIMKAGFWDPINRKASQVYVFDYPGSPLKVGESVEVAQSRELKPGQSAQVYVGLEPDGSPVRVGVVYCAPQGPVAQRIGKWIGRVKQWCHLKYKEPDLIEVWCSEPLQVSAKPTHEVEK